jgi:GNAT superfamily N-acetyltransferase
MTTPGLAGGPAPRRRPDPEIRPAGAADRQGIQDLIAGLSVRAHYLRFFTNTPCPGGRLLSALCGAADDRTDVLIATVRDATARDVIIGHAMAADRTKAGGRRITHLAVVVADEWRGRGVGSALVSELTRRAAWRGVGELVMDVLAENRHVLQMIGRRWPDARRVCSAGYVTITVALSGQAPPAAAPRRGRNAHSPASSGCPAADHGYLASAR